MKDDKRLKRKVRNSYIVSNISIALVLFLLGSVGYLTTAAMQVARTLQESVTVTVELRNGADEKQKESLRKRFEANELVSHVEYSSKDDKLNDTDFRQMLEQEFEAILEENPLLDSFELTLSADSADPDKLETFIAQIAELDGVDRVSYPAQTVERLHATIAKIRLVLLLFGGALLVISLILLNNTIRLAIYSKRYLINTMKLVGATKWFIMRPFLASSVWQGLAAGAGASALFGVALYGLSAALPELTTLAAMTKAMIIVGSMMAGRVALALLFTAVSVNRFVDMRSDKIHLY